MDTTILCYVIYGHYNIMLCYILYMYFIVNMLCIYLWTLKHYAMHYVFKYKHYNIIIFMYNEYGHYCMDAIIYIICSFTCIIILLFMYNVLFTILH